MKALQNYCKYKTYYSLGTRAPGRPNLALAIGHACAIHSALYEAH